VRRREPVAAAIRAAIDASKASGRLPRRHPAEVTKDRLIDHAIEWTCWSGAERDALSVVINALDDIAEGNRR